MLASSAAPGVFQAQTTGTRWRQLIHTPHTPAPMEMAQTQDVTCAAVRCPACAACSTSNKGPAYEISTATRPATTAGNRSWAVAIQRVRVVSSCRAGGAMAGAVLAARGAAGAVADAVRVG